MDSTVTALSRMLLPFTESAGSEATKYLANYRVDAETQRRMSELGAKCNAGTLTPEERAEYEALVDMGSVLAILKGRARQKLVEDGLR